jgi:putative membrane-bound dehydrogenase-like protein
LALILPSPSAPARADVGPATEKRFPPLVLPDGFKATLFASDPLVEYPSVIALGPRQGTLFVAHDYMTGLGVEIVRRDEIRLLEDTDGDGYADKSTVFAGGFNSIQGLASDGQSVFAMHAPLLTALGDTDDDGVADERRDLLDGLGLPPEENDNRLHCANGVVVGHDGWLYLALGDRGCDVLRPEGDRLVFRQGGILRCRPDGTDLHVFSGGMRNVYDIALDEELNVFVRDNENDGGDFMIRVCHSFHGADHGYPYLYYERPEEAMPPLADLGRGSSAGGACYLETAFPGEYRGALLFCEWGRAVVRYPLNRSTSGFATTKEFDFVAAAEDDPYGFKPTDLVVDRDGSVLISDWADGQRPKRGRGRIYRIAWDKQKTHGRDANLFDRLDSPSYHVRVEAQRLIAKSTDAIQELQQLLKQQCLGDRARLHAVWILARVEGEKSLEQLFQIAETDKDPRVRAQSVKAIADLTDPILAKHRLAAGRGSEDVAARLAKLAENEDPRVVLEVVLALGRLRWKSAPQWLARHLKDPDSALAHAALQTLRRAENWPAVLEWLDAADDPAVRTPSMHALALRAVSLQTDPIVVDGLLIRLADEANSVRRSEYADALGRVYKKPGPWEYWGFRPAPRKANTVVWSRTEAIGAALTGALADTSHQVRQAALTRMIREEIPVATAALTGWLNDDPQTDHAAMILDALSKKPAEDIQPLLDQFVRSESRSDRNRLAALSMYVAGLSNSNESRLADLAHAIEDGPVLAKLLIELGARAKVDCNALLLAKLDSNVGAVRTAALTALTKRDAREAVPRIATLLNDQNAEVRRAAVTAAGELKAAGTMDRLLELTKDDDPAIRAASIDSLRQLGCPRAVSLAVTALAHVATQLAGLEYLRDFGGPDELEAVIAFSRSSRSAEQLTAAVRVVTAWQDRLPATSARRDELNRAIAAIHGDSGSLIRWSVYGPFAAKKITIADVLSKPDLNPIWKFGTGIDSMVEIQGVAADTAFVAASSIHLDEAASVEFLASGSGSLEIWLDGTSVHNRSAPAAFRPNSDRFTVRLDRGMHRVVVRVSSSDGTARWHVRFRTKSSKTEHEQLAAAALHDRGNPQRGREIFLNVEKSQCLKCHHLNDEGARIGPDLTGLGLRFSRIHLVESILEPSRTIAPSYVTVAIVRTDGRLLSGVKVRETGRAVTIGDREGKLHAIPRDEIEELTVQPISTMPEGLEKQLTEHEFVDLIAFLMSQTGTSPDN